MSGSISTSRSQAAPAEAAHRLLKVGGVTPFTATDYPGKLAAVVFVQGCPWRCGYCHNPHLQPRLPDSPLQWSQVGELLKRRVGLIDAVVFSGGEPTIDPALPDAIREVSELGFQVGLHSGGIYPDRLAEVLPLLDWIGFDAKAPFDGRYERITGVANSGPQALECAQAVFAAGIDYEFRTTVHPDLLNEDDLMELAQTLSAMGVTNYALQVFRAQGCNSDSLKAAARPGYPGEKLVRELGALFPRFILRQD